MTPARDAIALAGREPIDDNRERKLEEVPVLRGLVLPGMVAALFVGGTVSAQTLGDLARKAEADRAAKDAREKTEKAAPPKKTFSNGDLDTRDGTQPPPVNIPKPDEVVASAPKGTINTTKFEGVYRAAKSIDGATAAGVTYVRFGELVQGLSTELSILADHGPFTEREQALRTLFSDALKHYEISATFWKMKIDASDPLWKGEIPIQFEEPGQAADTRVADLARAYGIPVADRFTSPPMGVSPKRYKAVPSDAMQYVWAKASATVSAAAALYTAK